MTNQLLVSLVNSVLGSGKPTARDNYAYHCPSCHHAKPKLEIQLTENREGKISGIVGVAECGANQSTLYSN